MRLLLIGALALLVAIAATPAAARSKIFPFPYSVDILENGLKLVTLPLSYPNAVSIQIVVRTGSRDEAARTTRRCAPATGSWPRARAGARP